MKSLTFIEIVHDMSTNPIFLNILLKTLLIEAKSALKGKNCSRLPEPQKDYQKLPNTIGTGLPTTCSIFKHAHLDRTLSGKHVHGEG